MKRNTINIMKVVLVAFSFCVVGCGGGSKGSATTASIVVALNQQFTVKVGQEVSIPDEGLKLSLNSVSEDSRCPEDVVCVWEGNAKVSLNITKTGQTPTTIELNTSPLIGPSEKLYLNYKVKLLALTPNKKSNQNINSGDYIASLSVSKMMND